MRLCSLRRELSQFVADAPVTNLRGDPCAIGAGFALPVAICRSLNDNRQVRTFRR
jgi:hypothetical protein